MWNLVLKNERFLQVFSGFGLISNTTDDAISSLEEFLWCFYGDPKMKKVESEAIPNQIQRRQKKH